MQDFPQHKTVSNLQKKIIIDSDVGIDDAMAIAFASGSSELEVLGIMTIFGTANIENSRKMRFIPTTGQFIHDIMQYYLAFYESRGFDKGLALHDPTPLIICCDPIFLRCVRQLCGLM